MLDLWRDSLRQSSDFLGLGILLTEYFSVSFYTCGGKPFLIDFPKLIFMGLQTYKRQNQNSKNKFQSIVEFWLRIEYFHDVQKFH